MTLRLFIALFLSLAFDVGVVYLSLFRSKPAIGVARLAFTATILGLSFIFKSIVGMPAHSLFLLVSLAYADVIVLAPIVGAVLIAMRKRRTVTSGAIVVAWLSFTLPLFAYWASFVEPLSLVKEEHTIAIAKEHAPSQPLKIAVLADIQCEHVTDHEREAIAMAMSFAPDLILLPGDLSQFSAQLIDERAPQWRELLAPLDAPHGVYFVLGNCDRLEPTQKLLAGTKVQLLVNRSIEFEHGGRHVTLGGVDLSFESIAAREEIHSLESNRERDDLRILLAHRPDVIYALDSPSRVDLVVAGHTHGGQVVLPFVGALITLSSVPNEVARGGYHELDGRRVYVSRGVGCERGVAPRVRFNCRPEVSCLTLRAAN